MKMRATKAFRYDTRRLLPGDVFEVARLRDVRLLNAIRKAVVVRDPVVLPSPPASLVGLVKRQADPLDHDGDGVKGGSTAPAGGDDLKAARAEYEAVLGKRPFPGWGIEVLREKIAAAKG